jgi:hypothetical protein
LLGPKGTTHPLCIILDVSRIKSIIRLKNSKRLRAQRAWLTGNSRARAAALYNMLNRLVQCLTSKLNNNSFQNKIGTLRPGHKSLWNFTKLIENKIKCIPAPKVDEKTLITDAEKPEAITSKFAKSHNNTMISPLCNKVRPSCSVLRGAEIRGPREIKGVVKKLRNGKAPGAMPMLLITSY